MIHPNTIVGNRYRVTRSLGGGGMKLVYLAEDLRLASRPCALAEMIDSFTSPETQRQAVAAFQREADMLAELNHEHIPRVYDRFSEQNRHYLVMEYVDGETLEQRLKAAGGKLDEQQVIEIALQVLETLEYLHGREPAVIYRDLKPSNVMIMPNSLVKLVDFGIARHFAPFSNATMIGTQGYAPPEQYRGKVEARSDLYALGATMHQALSGRDPTTEPPFSFPPLRKLAPTCNAALADLVGEALAYDVERRVPSAADFRRRLMAIKLQALTNGLPNDRAAAVAAIAAASIGKPQLPLPLKTASEEESPPTPPPIAAPPTLLTGATEILCPDCRRVIPADSRFCSYCAADLRWILGPDHVVSDPSAETVRLDEHRTPLQSPSPRRAEGLRPTRPSRLITLLVLCALAFAAVRLILYLIANAPDLSGRAEAPGAESGETTPVDPASAAREIALRQILDSEGYHSVRCKLRAGVVELWGSVPSETDRMMVEATAFSVTGANSMEDHLQVHD